MRVYVVCLYYGLVHGGPLDPQDLNFFPARDRHPVRLCPAPHKLVDFAAGIVSEDRVLNLLRQRTKVPDDRP